MEGERGRRKKSCNSCNSCDSSGGVAVLKIIASGIFFLDDSINILRAGLPPCVKRLVTSIVVEEEEEWWAKRRGIG